MASQTVQFRKTPGNATLRSPGARGAWVLLLLVLAFGGLACSGDRQAQSSPSAQPRIYHVALFSNREYQPWHDEVGAALDQEGFVSGKNLVITPWYAEGRDERLDDMAREIVASGVDVIVVASTPSIAAAIRATQSIPIVMASSADPVAAGFVRSLKKPGGNVTGLAVMSTEMSQKRLELLAEVIGASNRVGVLYDPHNSIRQLELEHTRAAAAVLGLEIGEFPVRNAEDTEAAYAAVRDWGAGALMVFSDSSLSSNRRTVIELAAANGLPAMYERSQWVEACGLLSYGPIIWDQYRRAGQMAAKILNGAWPGDMPVELPPRFELTVNISAAQALNLPERFVMRADNIVNCFN